MLNIFMSAFALGSAFDLAMAYWLFNIKKPTWLTTDIKSVITQDYSEDDK